MCKKPFQLYYWEFYFEISFQTVNLLKFLCSCSQTYLHQLLTFTLPNCTHSYLEMHVKCLHYKLVQVSFPHCSILKRQQDMTVVCDKLDMTVVCDKLDMTVVCDKLDVGTEGWSYMALLGTKYTAGLCQQVTAIPSWII